jgi:calcium-dependent protein kinase
MLKLCAICNLGNNERLFLQGDVDKDGYLDYGEFVAISIHLRKMGDDDKHLHKAFEFFDRNQSSHIEIEELRDALADDIETNSEEVINGIMHDVDTDKVGHIVLKKYFCD